MRFHVCRSMAQINAAYVSIYACAGQVKGIFRVSSCLNVKHGCTCDCMHQALHACKHSDMAICRRRLKAQTGCVPKLKKKHFPGWMGGCKSRFKDCLQQSKTEIAPFSFSALSNRHWYLISALLVISIIGGHFTMHFTWEECLSDLS